MSLKLQFVANDKSLGSHWNSLRLTGSFCVSHCLCFTGELYVSDKCGSDQDGDGTEQKPFKTPLKVNDHVALSISVVEFSCVQVCAL